MAEKVEIIYTAPVIDILLNNIDEGILVVDKECRIVYCNQVQLDFDGLKLADIVGRFTWDVYHFGIEVSTLLQTIEEGKPSGDYVQYYLTARGQYVRLTGKNFPLYENGQLKGAIGVYRNLQRSEEMVSKLVELQKKLQPEADDLTGDPAGGAAAKRYFTFSDILCDNQLMLESVKWAQAAARSDSPVFLYGETGTGKEMFAQGIHHASRRGQKALVSINCAAIPETLLEGIIFGTFKGAYTGATDRKGLFEEADGGTLFLDEINSMPLTLQGKLLRVLEEKKVRRLGGNQEQSVDVRIISSCNVDPSEAMQQRQLRSDLYYRLAVIRLDIPPLRQRIEDIRRLTQHFVKHFNVKLGKNVCEIAPEVYAMLEGYDWPGNVRQLKHWIEAAMNMIPEDEPVFSAKFAPRYFNTLPMTQPMEKSADFSIEKGLVDAEEVDLFAEIREQEYAKVARALKRHRGNITKAAAELGISRQVLYYRMRKLGIHKDGT